MYGGTLQYYNEDKFSQIELKEKSFANECL